MQRAVIIPFFSKNFHPKEITNGGDNHLIIVCLKIVTQISRYLTIKSPENMNDFENETAENLKQLLPSALVASKHVSTTQ